MSEESQDGHETWEWEFKQTGVVGSNVEFDVETKEVVLDMSDQKHHVCNQTKVKHRKGVSNNRKPCPVLLDNQSTCDVVVNGDFMKNIRTRDWTLRFRTPIGVFRITMIGEMHDVGTV